MANRHSLADRLWVECIVQCRLARYHSKRALELAGEALKQCRVAVRRLDRALEDRYRVQKH